MFKKNKRKYIKLGYVTDKKKEQERKQKQQRCNLVFDGENFYKDFNEFKDDIL